MTELEFIVANIAEHRTELLALNVEYMSWVFAGVDAVFGIRCADVIGMEAPDYVASLLDKVCDRQPPDGIFYLVRHRGDIAGMGGLRRLGPGWVEVKRIYVRPACRGLRLGERILARLLSDARHFGYDTVSLETAPFMEAAHRLYEQAGFADRSPYPEAEVPAAFHDRWRFMERPVAAPDPAAAPAIAGVQSVDTGGAHDPTDHQSRGR